jgi:hypothetical protein
LDRGKGDTELLGSPPHREATAHGGDHGSATLRDAVFWSPEASSKESFILILTIMGDREWLSLG